MKNLIHALITILVFLIAFVIIVPVKPILQQLFPIYYPEIIYEQALEHDLDPFLIAAMIRVESNWQTDAVSPKGATGLMQLMPDTADWVAQQLAIELSKDDLMDPKLNIKLGSWYINHLKEQFPTSTAVLAAYNGGLGNVHQWLANQRWDGTLKTAHQIPFWETRAYVHKVIITRNIYLRIYDYQWNAGEES